jgi:hypothetical protein
MANRMSASSRTNPRRPLCLYYELGRGLPPPGETRVIVDDRRVPE